MSEPLHDWTALRLAKALHCRQLRATDVVEHMLDRIAALDRGLRSYVSVSASEALAQAHRADAEFAAGFVRGPLHGVPIAVKDSLATKGIATTNGAARLTVDDPPRDAAAVVRLKRHGLVLLGKLNLPEGCFGLHDPAIGQPRNPWNWDYWPGASSSGPGVATAARLCFAAVGTDSGGSVRHPSAANNLFGLKPTIGAIDTAGAFPLAPSLDNIGPIARSPADLEALFIALTKAPRRSLDDFGDRIEPVRVGIDPDWNGKDVEPVISRALEEAVAVFVALGMTIKTVQLPSWHEATEVWLHLCAPEAAAVHAGRGAPVSPGLQKLIAFGGTIGAGMIEASVVRRRRLCSAIDDLFAEVDLILAPIQPFAPPRVDRVKAVDSEKGWPVSASDIGSTALFNLSGHPAMAMPAGFTAEGLPVGCQIIAAKRHEALLFHVARAFDTVTGFSGARPPLAETLA